MKLAWMHEPHPCKVCGTVIELAYPTCGDGACKTAWRRQAERNAYAARVAYRAAEKPELCTRCHQRKSKVAMEAGYATCGGCRLARRKKDRAKRKDAAYQAYREKLALARADRLIRDRVAETARIDAEAMAYVEAKYGLEQPDEIPAEEI